jgi:hypothetical protein
LLPIWHPTLPITQTDQVVSEGKTIMLNVFVPLKLYDVVVLAIVTTHVAAQMNYLLTRYFILDVLSVVL